MGGRTWLMLSQDAGEEGPRPWQFRTGLKAACSAAVLLASVAILLLVAAPGSTRTAGAGMLQDFDGQVAVEELAVTAAKVKALSGKGSATGKGGLPNTVVAIAPAVAHVYKDT